MVTFDTLWSALAIAFICVLVLCFIEAIGRWKLFEKAGESGWKAAVPILSTYTLFKLVWSPAMFGIHLLLSVISMMLIPMRWPFRGLGLVFVAAVFVISGMASWRIAKCFGKGPGYGICLVLLHPIFLPIIGWSYDRYMGNI